MLKLRKVAVTGGLSSGKSTVCSYLKELGAYVVSADTIGHQLLSPETNLGKKLIDLLGCDVINNKQFDRQKIAEKVFKDPLLLAKLESLLHPQIYEEIGQAYELAQKENFPLFVAEIALLFETDPHPHRDFDTVIAVDAPIEECLKRYIRSGGSEEQFFERSARQWTPAEKKSLADFTIMNDADIQTLKTQVNNLYYRLTA